MAITKLVSANTPNPLTAGAGGDWDLAMAQLTACKHLLTAKPMILTNWGTYTKPALAEGSYIQHLGSIYIVDTEDYELPTFSSDYSNYIKVTESGDTLAITIINSTSGYIWTPVYNGLYNGVHQLLPYRIDYTLPLKNYYKYRFIDIDCKVYMDKNGNITTDGSVTIGGSINATGAISGATVNTGQGNNELYAMNQNVRTTDSPTFVGIISTYKSGTVWATYGSITENDVFDNFSFIPLGATIIASGMFGDAAYDYTMVAIQRSDANNIIMHRHKAGDNTISTTTCTDGDATEVAKWVNISY